MNKLYLLLFFVALISCAPDELAEPSLIPQPRSLERKPGFFSIQPSTRISYHKDELKNEAGYLSDYIEKQTGMKLKKTRSKKQRNFIRLELSDKIKSNEGYQLLIDGRHVVIKGKTTTGVFYGIQSFLQLVPVVSKKWVAVPAVEIDDEPRFAYRGMHLDVCRHYFDTEFIKKMLDAMAYYKLNRFHWHLTDDQGWRIEINQYPRLTEIGAWRNNTLIGHASATPEQFDTLAHGGFYTHAQIRDIVDYAAGLHITIIPEIEMPGHAQAALASYCGLGCFDKPLEVWNKWGVSDHVLCAGKDSTFEFLENVLSEVADLFPGEYIHIGGDECPKEHWEKCARCQERIKKEGLANEQELQSYFIRRIEKFLESKGKKIIGWDEILEGGLAGNATVMSWRGEEGGIEAAKMGHEVIMTPNAICYFDHYQGDPSVEPLSIGGMTTLSEVYAYDPVPDVLGKEAKNFVIGTQANVWTEYISTTEHAEYMIFPRLCALSEIAWTEVEKKDFSGFMTRLERHGPLLKSLKINYRKID